MRILLLSNLYPPYVQGGAEILAGDIATGLKKLGHELFVLTSWFGLPGARQDEHIWRTLQNASATHFDRHRPVWQQFDLLRNYYRQYHNSANVKELRRVITEIHPDVLYIWEINGIGINSLLSLLPELKMPIVFHLGSYWLQYAYSPQTEHSHLQLRSFKKMLIGSVPKLTYTSLIAVSGTVKEEYVQAGCDAERIEVIYNGIDARFLDTPQSREVTEVSVAQKSQLIYVGRLRVEKGILIILKALDILINQQKRQNLQLNIFGDGDEVYIGELKAFIREKQLTEAVTFYGKIPQDELIGHYDRSDIMLVPSLWKEPFGLVVAEGMARGLPVIASNVGGPAEIITHQVNGLLIEPADEKALALSIAQLLEDPGKRQLLAQAARSTVRERFMIDENARNVEQHLLRVLQIRESEADRNVLSSTN